MIYPSTISHSFDFKTFVALLGDLFLMHENLALQHACVWNDNDLGGNTFSYIHGLVFVYWSLCGIHVITITQELV